MKSKVIALSAISAAFIAILLTLGAYIEFFDLVSVILASVFVLLPIYFRSYKGCFLSCLAGTLIAFIFSGFNFLSLVFPSFLLFFGIYPIIKCLVFDKNYNRNVFYFISAIWCIAVCYGIYFFYINVYGLDAFFAGFPTWVEDYILVIIGLFGLFLYFVFDKFVFMTRIIINRYLSRIIK